MKKFIITVPLLLVCTVIYGQDWFKMNVLDQTYEGNWSFPYSVSQFSHYDFSNDGTYVKLHRTDEENDNHIPFITDLVDSITFYNAPEEYLKDKYKVFTLNITTDRQSGVPFDEYEKEYVRCFISLDGKGQYPDYSGAGKIRGRGNSTWRWYPKKPYRIKLDTKAKLLGIDKNRDWVLLANYRDPTDVMNTFGMVTGKWMGVKYTSPIRFCEVFLDGEYIGVYQLAQQIEQGNDRVEIAADGGILLNIDVDDGPNGPYQSVADTCNFTSSVYHVPVGVKYPEDANLAKRNEIKAEFAKLETAIRNHDYELLDSICDIQSYIAIVAINALLDNDDFTAPRSTYISKDPNGKWTFGPAWDFDAGYAFNWSPMVTSKTFFGDYRSNYIIGTNPASKGKYYTDMFNDKQFTERFINQWNEWSDSIYTRNWDICQKFIDGLEEENNGLSAQQRDYLRWNLDDNSGSHEPQAEIEKMKEWLQNRVAFMTSQINTIPIPDDKGGGSTEYSYDNGNGLFLDKLTKVGEQTISAEYDMQDIASMEKQNIYVDFEEILQAFPEGADLYSLQYMAYNNRTTKELTSQKSSSDGFYMNFEGDVCQYGNVIMECKVGCQLQSGKMTFAYTGSPDSGSKCTASVFLVYDNQYYYELKMNVLLDYGGQVKRRNSF